jgi:hypothetical protein
MSAYGIGIQSVAVGLNFVAVAVEATPTVDTANRRTAVNGRVVLLDFAGGLLKNVEVGVLPDHVSFTPDKKTILVANEGEPVCALDDPATTGVNESTDPALVSDPLGTVSLIDVKDGAANATVTKLDFAKFAKDGLLNDGVRVFFPGSSAAQDLEPEYITTNEAGTQAYVTLQEANSIAIVDVVLKRVIDVVSLDYKDWGSAGLLYDGSKKDGPTTTSGALANPISYAGVPLKGMYMPDTIASYTVSGQTYLVTANEGDARDYTCFKEESTFGDTAGADSFASYWDSANDAVKPAAKLGEQKTTLAFPTKIPVVGSVTNLYTFGGRSFSIRNANGSLVWDSGSEFEEIALRDYPTAFNSDSNSSAGSSAAMVQGQPARIDGRSTSKGVEPEGLAVGAIGTQTFAFIGLERMGGIMTYEISKPNAPQFISYTNLALAGLARANNTTPGSYDVSPESLVFVPAAQSPISKPLLIVANELSGTTTLYEVRAASPIVSSPQKSAKSLSKSVGFTAGSSVLSNASKSALKKSVATSGLEASYVVTGTAGLLSGVSEAQAKKLAKKRANATKAYLVKLGVNSSNITIKIAIGKLGVSPKTKILASYLSN